jgi:predicted DNA-binding ribbon-helix-helix protein
MSAAARQHLAQPASEARLAPRFRVLVIDGVRRAFKLEPVYWSALSLLAARRRRTLSAEVVERLRSAPPAGNQSAFLRASIVGDLYDTCQTQQAIPSWLGWAGIVDAIAEPAFAATPGGRLTAINPRMRALLQSRGLGCEADPGDVALELAPDVLTLLNHSQRTEAVICSAGFRRGAERVISRVRIVPTRAATGQGVDCLLLGFSAPT